MNLNQSAILFKKGMDALPDTEVALEFFNRSADFGNVNALEKIISINYTERNLVEYKIAVDKFFAIAAKGNTKAAKIIFNLILEESLAEEDVSKGGKMLLYFAKAKHLESIKFAHELISEEKIFGEDAGAVFNLLFSKAKNSKSFDLIFRVGESFIYGWGTDKNFSAAQFWFQKLAAMENSCNDLFERLDINIAKTYLTGNFNAEKIKMLKNYKRRARKGEELAITSIAEIYCEGNIIANDGYEGIKWLQKISENMKYDAIYRHEALYSIAEIYRYGKGVAADGEQAIKYFKMTMEQNRWSIAAVRNVAEIYLNGAGNFPADKNKYVEWIKQFSAEGCIYCTKKLAELYATGNLVEKDEAAAIKLYEKIVDASDPRTQIEILRKIAYLYKNIDKKKSDEIYQQAKEKAQILNYAFNRMM